MPGGHLDLSREKLEGNKVWCGLWSLEYFWFQQRRVQRPGPYSQPGAKPTATASCTVWGAGLIKEGHIKKVCGETLAVRS